MHPKHTTNRISRIFGRIADKRHSPTIQRLINRAYVFLFRLDMNEYKPTESYQSLNELFTRSLIVKRAMPRNRLSVISPCDSLITECGRIMDKTIFQIKGVSYSVDPFLLNIDAKRFDGGSYQNFYLSPRDYHHYHAPCDLKLIRVIHIPGRLYPVNKPFLRSKRNLFCLNERAVLEAEDRNGKRWVLVFVAALNVGKISFEFMPEFESLIETERSSEHKLNTTVKRGDSLGYFKMGSTIVMISQEGAADFSVASGQKVKFSEEIGILPKAKRLK